jgi:hypothetical protein
MLPHERSLVEKWKDEPFAIVGINSDPVERFAELVKDGTTTWRSFRNEQEYGKISTKWAVTGWPTLYILDHKGVIRHIGLRGEAMEEAMAKLIEEAKAE